MDLRTNFDAGFEGFAKANSETLEALSKAFEAGSGVDAGAFTGGRALTPESLDSTLVNVLWNTDEARLFQRLKKKPVKSVVHQWNYRNEVGEEDSGAWVPEGGSSADTDQAIERRFTTAKYLQTKRTVTLQAAQSNMLEDAIAIEQEAGALWMIRQTEKALFTGNSAHNPYIMDGLDAQITGSENIIDLRGQDATTAAFENAMNEGARKIRDFYGVPTHLFTSTMIMQDVQNLLRDRIRYGDGMNLGTGIFREYPTPFGQFELVDDVFIKEGLTVPAQSTLTGRPGTGTALTISLAAAGSGSQFAAGDAGNYNYEIVPVNRYGRGAAVEGQITGVTAGQSVTITVTQAPVPAATSYEVYRSQVGGGSGAETRYAFTVDAATAEATGIVDSNAYLPGCGTTYMLNMSAAYNAIEWVQFLPMMKFDLYPTDSAVYPFLMLLFGSLAVKKPEQHVRVINVAPSHLGWF